MMHSIQMLLILVLLAALLVIGTYLMSKDV